METEQDTEREEKLSRHSPSTVFVGRSDILDTARQHLLTGRHVYLYGDRGIGKTAIPEEVVRWLREEKPGLRVIPLADEMTFKHLLVPLARELHTPWQIRYPKMEDEIHRDHVSHVHEK